TTLDTSYFVLFSSCFSDASDLPSFPTRRSSDLGGGAAGARQRTPSCTGRPPTSRRSWMNLRRRLLLVLAGVLLATGAKAQGTFNYPMSADPEHLDPRRSTTVATRPILVNVNERLTTIDSRTAEGSPALTTGRAIR